MRVPAVTLQVVALSAMLLACAGSGDARDESRDAASDDTYDGATTVRPDGAPEDADRGGGSEDSALPSAMPDAQSGDAARPDTTFADNLDSVARAYDAGFLAGDAGEDLVVRADRYIGASPEKVWALVRNVNGYETFSESISAHADPIAAGSTIALSIQLLDPPFAKTDSEELIFAIDDALHAAAWTREFSPEESTRRFQVVTRDGNGAHYYTALHFPPMLGAVMRVTLADSTKRAFEKFALELEAAALKP